MADLSPAARKRRQQQLWGVIAIVAIMVVAIVVVTLRIIAGEHRVALDPKTKCPVGRSPAAFEIVLVDATEGFNDSQQLFLQKYFSTLDAEIPDHAKVAVYVLDGTEGFGPPAPTFEMCKPPSGKDASAWTQNPERLRREWSTSFHDPLGKALESSLAKPGSNESPIMALIQKAVLTSFPLGRDGAPRRLVLISDLLENTKSYSHYGATPPTFETFRKQPIAPHLRIDLSGVDVEVLYVTRVGQERTQGMAHLDFWKDYFVWLGVGPRQLRITPVPG